MNNREAFEAWFESQMHESTFQRKPDGDYEEGYVDYAWAGWQAALESQQKDHIPNVGQMVEVSEHGEGQENDCPECGAEAGSSCSSDEGIEYGRRVHEVRQSHAQQKPLKVSENWREPLSADAMQRLKNLGVLDKSPAPEGGDK